MNRLRLFRILFLIVILLQIGWTPVKFQTQTPGEKAALLLQQLTPEERVGQLFLVTFQGNSVNENSEIYSLITNNHVGGVVLLAANDNFTSGQGAPRAAWDLIRQLQQTTWAASQQERTNPVTNQVYRPVFIPLFSAIPQEGDLHPYDQLWNGLPPLPNQMALGATWNPELTSQIGSILGQELTGLGINMLIGPSLDVLEGPPQDSANNLGTRSFGGDPYWVGELGSAFIQGVHLGSQGKVAVVAKHFPGHGGSDRLPEEEVATVRKSLEQLKNFELSPFFAVTGYAASPEATADGLLASHIRYQGFQGNIRATTRPVSFDPQAFGLLMSLPQIESWRKNGGVMVSDNLGSPAIRRFYDLTNQPFDMPRRVALNAFLAGNDLLYIADFSSGDIDSYNSTLRTLEFFSQKYREDPAFAQRVDESVLRILTLKYRLYENFSLGLILAPATGIDNIANASETTFQVAREAATLISPTKQELDDTVPDAPNLNDRVVFITEVRSAQQCSQCPEQDLLGVDDFQQVVIRRYGPQAGGQVSPNNLSSFSLSDLELMLNTESGSSLIERDLRRANWIVFSLVKPELDQASYEILQRFLFERPDLIQQKRLFVYGFNAPYYLDATDISKLTAFYALYSKVPQFIDVAAYLLFRELQPTGSLPVSVPAVGYDLNSALFPDPNLTIPLALDLPLPETLPGTATPEPAPIPEYRVGDIIPVRAGVILDHNGHPVPDGTQVEFILSMSGQAQTINQIAITVDGVARSSFQVNDPGTLEIRAESEPAKNSDVLRFDILPINGEQISPTPIPEPTQTPTPTATIPPIVTTASGQTVPSLNQTQFGDWLIAILIIAAIGWTFYRLAALAGQIRWGIRGGFLAIIGGMLAYTYLALDFPGSEVLLEESIARGVVITSIAGCIAGIFIALLWRAVTHRTTT